METIRGKTLEYWKQNAEEDYMTTPISVLKYITILEEVNQALRQPAVISTVCVTCEKENRMEPMVFCRKCLLDAQKTQTDL